MITISCAKKAFSDFELQTDIGKLLIQNIPIWEIIRFQAFQNFCVRAGILDVGHPRTPKTAGNYLRFGLNMIRSSISRYGKKLNSADILIAGHPRLLKNSKGLFEDPYSEAYLKNERNGYYFLERSFRGSHFVPRVTKNTIPIDDIVLRASRTKKRILGTEKKRIEELEDQFYFLTGYRMPLVDMVTMALGQRNVLLPFYGRMIKKIKPKVGITVVAYNQAIFIEACRSFNIPTVEIQHGVISNFHYGYNFDTFTPSYYYPDYLWLWGTYWKHAAEYSPKIKLRTVGFPLFEKYRYLKNRQEENSCMFVSQGSVGDKIAEYALQLRRDMPELKIYYRLHPSEFDSWEKKYHELPKMGIKILGREDGSIYNWFGKVKYIIGVYSTALFEAIGIGCRVGVLNLPGIEYMETLIKKKGVCKIEKSWKKYFDGTANDVLNANNIFEPFSTKKVKGFLQEFD